MTFKVPSRYFVIYEGDLERDPLDRGVEDFNDFLAASSFKKRMENVGMKVTVYFGEVSGVFHPDIGRHGNQCQCKRCIPLP